MAHKRPRSALELTSQLNSKRPLSPENLLVKKKNLMEKKESGQITTSPMIFWRDPQFSPSKEGGKTEEKTERRSGGGGEGGWKSKSKADGLRKGNMRNTEGCRKIAPLLSIRPYISVTERGRERDGGNKTALTNHCSAGQNYGGLDLLSCGEMQREFSGGS